MYTCIRTSPGTSAVLSKTINANVGEQTSTISTKSVATKIITFLPPSCPPTHPLPVHSFDIARSRTLIKRLTESANKVRSWNRDRLSRRVTTQGFDYSSRNYRFDHTPNIYICLTSQASFFILLLVIYRDLLKARWLVRWLAIPPRNRLLHSNIRRNLNILMFLPRENEKGERDTEYLPLE